MLSVGCSNTTPTCRLGKGTSQSESKNDVARDIKVKTPYVMAYVTEHVDCKKKKQLYLVIGVNAFLLVFYIINASVHSTSSKSSDLVIKSKSKSKSVV